MLRKETSGSWIYKRGVRTSGVLILAGALMYTAVGCSGSSNKEGSAITEQQPVQTASGTSGKSSGGVKAGSDTAGYRAPLTGLPVSSPVEQRPVMVMINNHPSARPQSGLSQADLLMEVLAEGEVTRIMAVYQSKSFEDPIGPVRSIRPYFIELGKGLDALQVHAGGSPDAYVKLDKERIDELDEITNAGPYFWRESFRKAPHNLYTSLNKIQAGAEKQGILMHSDGGGVQPAYRYESGQDAVPVMGATEKEAGEVDITFLLDSYKVSYEYQAERGLYQRLINGIQHIDLNSGEALTAANVVAMGTDHKVLDAEGRLEVRTIGSGPALLFQQGKVRQVEWRRDREKELLRFYDHGQEAAFLPGQTHILIVPVKPSFEHHVKY